MTDEFSRDDEAMMRRALKLAAVQSGKTGSNPAVGCVIVQDGMIVGQGATADGGRPHGEAMALAQAEGRAAGATVYVTLEPCAHSSTRGPDCANTLIAAKIARLVCCLEDPDRRTSGLGIQRLRQAGIKVEVGLLSTQGKEQIASFAVQFLSKPLH